MGFVGTAKNTGKTTALIAVMSEAASSGLCVAVTSIGYDGEDADTLTGLPKPRIRPGPGSILATAEKCVEACGAPLKVLRRTSANTPLGQVLVCRVMSPGSVPIAGPNSKRDLKTVLDELKTFRPDILLVDGAFSRVSPMSLVDCIVVSTGAARSLDPCHIATEMTAIAGILSLPPASSPVDSIHVQGVITPELIDTWNRVIVTLESPVAVLADHRPVEAWQALGRAFARGVKVFVRKPLALAAVTFNPVFPHEHEKGRFIYKKANEQGLKQRLTTLGVPVVDVVADGPRALFATISTFCNLVAAGKDRREMHSEREK